MDYGLKCRLYRILSSMRKARRSCSSRYVRQWWISRIVRRRHTYPRAQVAEKGRINKNSRVPLNAFQRQIKSC